MSTALQQITADELFARRKDGFRYELVKGELRKMSPAGSEHGAIIVNITFLIVQHVKANNLAVEVLSPGDSLEEVEEKVEDWLSAGARAVWVVSPKRRGVSVYRSMTDVTRLSESDELDGGEGVPGFRCKVSEIFV